MLCARVSALEPQLAIRDGPILPSILSKARKSSADTHRQWSSSAHIASRHTRPEIISEPAPFSVAYRYSHGSISKSTRSRPTTSVSQIPHHSFTHLRCLSSTGNSLEVSGVKKASQLSEHDLPNGQRQDRLELASLVSKEFFHQPRTKRHEPSGKDQKFSIPHDERTEWSDDTLFSNDAQRKNGDLERTRFQGENGPTASSLEIKHGRWDSGASQHALQQHKAEPSKRSRVSGEVDAAPSTEAELKHKYQKPAPSATRWIQLRLKDGAHAEFSRAWLAEFAWLSASLDSRPSLIEDQGPEKPKWEKDVLNARVEHIEKMGATAYWGGNTPRKVRLRWAELMLHYLQGPVPRALAFMKDVLPFYRPPAYQVADTIDLLARRTRPSSRTSDLLWNVLRDIGELYDPSPLYSQQTLLRLLQGQAGKDLTDCYDWLDAKDVYFQPDTTVHIATLFARDGQAEKGMELINLSIERGIMPKEGLPRATSAILREIRTLDGNYGRVTELIASTLKFKPQLDSYFYNVLIANAADAKDSATAWQLFDTMEANGIAPDDHTFRILLAMCRKIGGAQGKEGFRFLYDQIVPEERDHLEPHLLAELLTCQYAFSWRGSFDQTLQLYERFCHVAPLKDLGILSENYRPPQDDGKTAPKPLPDVHTLGVMVIVFIRHLRVLPRTRRRHLLHRLYYQFREQIGNGDQLAVKLASTDTIYNAFLKAFSNMGTFFSPRISSSLSPGDGVGLDQEVSSFWLDILKAMQKPFPRSVIDDRTGETLKPPKPSRQSWNIVVNACAHRGNEAEVDRVLKAMKRQGFEPDLVTWNSLLKGFAMRQRADVVAKVLNRMKQASVVGDDFTVQALSNVADRQQLLRLTRYYAHAPKAKHRFVSSRRKRIKSHGHNNVQ